jgi:DNA-directed RNA polymerase subunit RPC12/RpoP
MVKYRIWPTGEVIEIENLKEYNMPYTGAKVLFKEKSSIAREVKTD